MSIQEKILKDLIKYIPQVIVPAILGFISVPIFTRIFDPISYGNLNILRVTINIFERLSGIMSISLIRYYSIYENENKKEIMLTSLIKVNILFSVIILIVGYIVIFMVNLNEELKLLFLVGILYFSLNLIKKILDDVLRIQRKINLLSIFILVNCIGGFIVGLVLISVYEFRIEGIIVGNLIITAILFPYLWIKSMERSFKFKIQIDAEIIKKFISYGLPLTVSNLAIWLIDMSDRYVIGYFLSIKEVGIYSSCYNIVWNALFIIVNLFYMMEQPLAMKVYINDGEVAFINFLRKEIKIYLTIMTPCVLLMISFAGPIFKIMVDQKYQGGTIIVPYIAISTLIIGLIHKFNLSILVTERNKSLMYIVFLAGFSNIFLNLILVPKMGMLGAGISTLVSYIFYSVLVMRLSLSCIKIKLPIIDLMKILSSSLISFLPLCYLSKFDLDNIFLIICAIISIIAYIIILFLSKEFKISDFNKRA